MKTHPIFGDEPVESWIERYERSHLNPLNRACHTLGIPLIALSLLLLPFSALLPGRWRTPAAMFGAGWALQFLGHGFEGKPPEFLHDWRFLFVGLRWWLARVRGA
jgi:uncharacterized membrane protein YGL010W